MDTRVHEDISRNTGNGIICWFKRMTKMKLRVEYLHDPKLDTTSVYVWNGMKLLDKNIFDGSFSKEEKLKMSTKLIENNLIKREQSKETKDAYN